MAAMTPLLTTHGLTKTYDGLSAVDGVELSLVQGEIRALIGPNGAGKTTLVGLICGRVPQSSGTIIFDGEDITRMPAHLRVRRGIAYTFQVTSVFANLSAYDNVALPAQRSLERGHATNRLHAAVMDTLERTGLAERADTPAGALSYGHQRLLEVAMGLALKPRLLILDEPTQGLSDSEIEGFMALVRDIARNATVLMIEHNMDVVMGLAQRITVMNAGRILAEGTPAQIREDEAVQRAYLGTENHG
jgi:branched-chain amino acid transport system ATP-binding protein